MKSFLPRIGLRAAWGFALFIVLFAPASLARATTLIGLTDSNRLVIFDSSTPQTIAGSVQVTGLQTDEQLLGIDFRPNTNQLYGVGSTSRLYRINIATGVATQVGAGPFAPALNVSAEGGFEVGVDFEPLQGWLRVVSNGQSLRLDANSGTVVALDAPLFYSSTNREPHFGATPRVTAIAYGSTYGQPGFTLYGIDSSTSRLVRVGSRGGSPVSPNTGEVFDIGALFVAFGFPDNSRLLTDKAGFDITSSGLAFASLTVKGAPSSALHILNLTTGEATEVGAIGTSGMFLRGLAVPPEATDLLALTVTNKLLLFNANMPSAILRSTQITGLQAGENILAIELRAKDGRLYAFANTSRVYTVDPSTGAATPFGNPLTPPLGGTEFSTARDTFRDQMRIVTDADDSRLFGFGLDSSGLFNIKTGTLAYASDDPAAGSNPKVVGLAATFGSERVGFSLVYYGIDSDKDTLVFEDERDLGTLHTVGSLNVATNEPVGFDIAFAPYAALRPICFEGCPAPSGLFTIDLQTGRATLVGWLGGGEIVRDIVLAPARMFHFARLSYSVEENCTGVQLTVVRTGEPFSPATIDYATTSDGPLPVPPANPRSDYNAAAGTLRFAAGETSKTITLLINEDAYNERANGFTSEGFRVLLSNPSLGYTLGGGAVESVVIINEDEDTGTASENPIDDTATFVCQQYHDFLNREPDESGFAFWQGNIESCTGDARCIELKRIETSAAFFLSIEYQETGFFVYRTYKAAFGRTPVPLTFAEFMRDARRVGEGVIIGQPGALERLEANKQEFIKEFINRREFLELYPFIRPNEAANFVDSLNANAGGVLSQAERDALVKAYLEKGREFIVRTIVEDEDYKRSAFNRAFVLSQYFGYLQRNPNDPPDNNFDGFNFWLRKLDEHNGDFRRAEMVKAFITSGEYRHRFGPQ